MTTVAPGDETGLYHITLCNLPFGTSWSSLKDWICTACEVDHIEVFPQSTSAWVRVKGKENFTRAWGLLERGIFQGRRIIASDKNKSESIKIKDPVYPHQVSYSQAPGYSSTPLAPYGSPTSWDLSSQYSAIPSGWSFPGNDYNHASAANYASSQSSASQGYGYEPSIANTAKPATYTTAGPGEYYTFGDYAGGSTFADQSMRRAPYTANGQTSEIQYTLPYRGQPEPMSRNNDFEVSRHEDRPLAETVYGAPGSSDAVYLATEQRKVVISGFPQGGKLADVKAWIRRTVGSENISSIDVPLNGNATYLRGHAFIIFQTVEEATNAVEIFNTARFLKRKIKARLTVEGVTAGERLVESYQPIPNKARQAESTAAPPEPVTGPSRSTDDQLPGGESSHQSKHSKHSKLKDKKGSSGKKVDKKPPSSKKRSSDKKPDNDSAPPLIADGSSRKRDKA